VSVALVIPLAILKCRIILSDMTCQAIHVFPHYLTNGMISGKGIVEHKTLNIFTTFFGTFLTLRRNERDFINVRSSSSKVPAILVRM